MSEKAIKLIKSTDGSVSKKIVEAEQERKYDGNCKYVCLDCGCPMYFVKSSKNNYYFSAGPAGHSKSKEPGRIKCKYDESKDYEKIYIGVPIINPFSALNFNDSSKIKSLIKTNGKNYDSTEDKTVSDLKKDKEPEYLNEGKKLSNIRKIFEEFCEKNPNDHIPVVIDKSSNTVKEVKVKELFIHKYTIKELLHNDLEGPKLLVCSKINPQKFDIKLDFGEICFKINNYTRDGKNTIFVKIRLKDPTANKFFLNDVFKSEEHKNENIVILANLQAAKNPNKDIKIYSSTISSKCYFWISKEEVEKLTHP